MTPFNGFSEEIFECCKPSEKIRKPINALKELRLEIKLELKKINQALIGHVSRTKRQGTNEYNDWAWLYFNTIGTGGHRYSQLTVNISPTQFLSSLETTDKLGECHLPKKSDQYSIKRTALEFNLAPYELDFEGKKVIIYSDKDVKLSHNEILRIYPEFSKRLDQIRELLYLPKGFLKIMFVNPKSDARYHKIKESNSIFLNMARFETNKNLFFWLFSVSRELAYIRAHRLGYQFINQLRDILTIALNNFQLSESPS
jgi:hypothetical protein